MKDRRTTMRKVASVSSIGRLTVFLRVSKYICPALVPHFNLQGIHYHKLLSTRRGYRQDAI